MDLDVYADGVAPDVREWETRRTRCRGHDDRFRIIGDFELETGQPARLVFVEQRGSRGRGALSDLTSVNPSVFVRNRWVTSTAISQRAMPHSNTFRC